MFFGKKKPKDSQESASGETPASIQPNPAKADPWFRHADNAKDSLQNAYALKLFASGLSFDNTRLDLVESILSCAILHRDQGGKSAPSSEKKEIEGMGPYGKFASAYYAWLRDLGNIKVALEFMRQALAFDSMAWANHHANTIFKMHLSGKTSKKGWVELMRLCGEANNWDLAQQAGAKARELDPSDGDLDTEMKNLAASRAMTEGGYTEAAGNEGGFRKMIKDADKQKELQEEETLAGGAETAAAPLERARQAYEADPADTNAVAKLLQLLRRVGDSDAMNEAKRVALAAFKTTSEYRFRMFAGDLEIKVAEQRLEDRRKAALEDADNQELALQLEEADRSLQELKLGEYSERVEKYPTDRKRKYDLGTVLFRLGRTEEAMAQFQAAKDEPRLHADAAHNLGLCFHAEGWFVEAVAEFDEALSRVESSEREKILDMKYDLMLGLIEGAKAEKDLEMAQRAKSICSEIARTNIAYRDIRDRRREVDEVIGAING
ncbi:MAG: hypothetical protein CBB84_005095 [Phycisphaera sp. TMED24]|nr:MAG: hypothetical protein CBB84_005095 [Phycisphaera sp. TMED24]